MPRAITTPTISINARAQANFHLTIEPEFFGLDTAT